MLQFNFRAGFFKSFAFCVAFGLMMFVLFGSSHAQTVTFAQFSQTAAGQDFVFTNNGTSAAFTTIQNGTPAQNGTPVRFTFSNIAGLPNELSGPQNARLYLTTTTTAAAIDSSGALRQPFDQVVTVEIIRDTAATVGRGSRRNLLTATFFTNTLAPVLTGDAGDSAANLNASTPSRSVFFSSNFLTFNNTTARNLALSFSSVTPALSLNANGLLNSFTAAATATFASNPPPVYSVTTAANVLIGGRVFNRNGGALSNARVTLTTIDGATRSVLTNSFGYYSFADVAGGQNVLLTVASKRYAFAPQSIAAFGETTNFDFYPE